MPQGGARSASDEGEAIPDAFQVPGIAHCEVEQMLGRMQYLIGGTAEPREQDGPFADTQSGAVS